jgi:hypothetical protein
MLTVALRMYKEFGKPREVLHRTQIRVQRDSSSGVLLSASYFVSLYGVLFVGVYAIVGIESRWRLDREREMISDATSEPYCSASCLRKEGG